jgi:hypothetical protein
VDIEGAQLVGGAVVPDDPHPFADVGDPEAARGVVAPELGAAAGRVRAAALAHADVADRLAGAQRDLPVAAAERPAERVGDLLVDDEAAVLRDLHRDRRLRQRERLGRCGSGERQCGENRRGECAR